MCHLGDWTVLALELTMSKAWVELMRCVDRFSYVGACHCIIWYKVLYMLPSHYNIVTTAYEMFSRFFGMLVMTIKFVITQ